MMISRSNVDYLIDISFFMLLNSPLGMLLFFDNLMSLFLNKTMADKIILNYLNQMIKTNLLFISEFYWTVYVLCM